MSTIEIKVRNDKGEKVVYENDYIPLSKYREYLVMSARHENTELGLSETEKFDEQVTFIASLFPGLDSEMIYNGLEMSDFNDVVAKVFTRLIGASDDDPKDNV